MYLRLIDISDTSFTPGAGDNDDILSMQIDYYLSTRIWRITVDIPVDMEKLSDYETMREFQKDVVCLAFGGGYFDKEHPASEEYPSRFEELLDKKFGNYIVKFSTLLINEPDREDWWDVITVEEFDQRVERALKDNIKLWIRHNPYPERPHFINIENKLSRGDAFDVFMADLPNAKRCNKARKLMLKAINTVKVKK